MGARVGIAPTEESLWDFLESNSPSKKIGGRGRSRAYGVQLMRLNWMLILPAIKWSLLPDFTLAFPAQTAGVLDFRRLSGNWSEWQVTLLLNSLYPKQVGSLFPYTPVKWRPIQVMHLLNEQLCRLRGFLTPSLAERRTLGITIQLVWTRRSIKRAQISVGASLRNPSRWRSIPESHRLSFPWQGNESTFPLIDQIGAAWGLRSHRLIRDRDVGYYYFNAANFWARARSSSTLEINREREQTQTPILNLTIGKLFPFPSERHIRIGAYIQAEVLQLRITPYDRLVVFYFLSTLSGGQLFEF